MSADHTGLQIEATWQRGGKARVVALLNGKLVHADNLDPASELSRQRFKNALSKKAPALTPDRLGTVDQDLLKLIDGCGEQPAGSGNDPASAEELLGRMGEQARRAAQAMLAEPLLFKQIAADVQALGIAGEVRLAEAVYTVGTSRLLFRPLAAIVRGPSSSGKTYIVEQTSRLFPPEATIHATQMTPQALFHMPPGGLANKFIVAGERSRMEEDVRAEQTRALREMISTGRLSKLMPVKGEGGVIQTVLIEQEGPIAYVETTTLSRIFEEDANRCLLLATDERPQQTRKIIRATAAAAAGRGPAPGRVEAIIAKHHAAQRMLQALPVHVPFADRLGERFPDDRVESRRAFGHVLHTVQAVALLHQLQRDRSESGELKAEPPDYQLAVQLLSDALGPALGGVSAPAKRFWEKVTDWFPDGDLFTVKDVIEREGGSKSSVYGWVSELHEHGLLELVEPPRGRMPARYRPTGKDIDEVAGVELPGAEDLFEETVWAPGHKPEEAAA
jgi:hypothetical protein